MCKLPARFCELHIENLLDIKNGIDTIIHMRSRCKDRRGGKRVIF